MQILRADVGGRRITIEPVPEAWTKLGGRGLCVKILLQEMDPSTDHLPDRRIPHASGRRNRGDRGSPGAIREKGGRPWLS
jgi:hypothetical protein